MDLTTLLYTASVIPGPFAEATRRQLLLALGDIPLITIVKPPEVPRSQAQIYRQVLQGAKEATTKYVACVEDDCLYHEEHFKHRPSPNTWSYNMNSWSIFTWGEPMFTQKPGGRRNLSQLICERELLIEHLEERFRLWPGEVNINIFGEPGKYDNQLGTKPYPSENFYTNPPNIVFSHQTNLQFEGLGTRKKVGQIRATDIPYWGKAEDVRKLYA